MNCLTTVLPCCPSCVSRIPIWRMTSLCRHPQRAGRRSLQRSRPFRPDLRRCGTTGERPAFQGLHFSPLDTLVTVLWNEFAAEVPEGSARSVALQLLPECRKVFAGYTLSDDFMFSPEFGQLYDELTGTVVIWLEENGL